MRSFVSLVLAYHKEQNYNQFSSHRLEMGMVCGPQRLLLITLHAVWRRPTSVHGFVHISTVLSVQYSRHCVNHTYIK